MADFRVGDRVRTTDTRQLSGEFRNQIGTVIDDDELVVEFDSIRNPSGLRGWYVPANCVVLWVDAPLDTPEDIERYLDA